MNSTLNEIYNLGWFKNKAIIVNILIGTLNRLNVQIATNPPIIGGKSTFMDFLNL